MTKANLRVLTPVLWGAMIFWGLLLWNFQHDGGLRFTSYRLNTTSEALSGFVPAIVLFVVSIAPFARTKWWLVAGLTPIALSALCMGWFGSVFQTAPTLLQTIPMRHSQIRVYQEHNFLEIDPEDQGPLIVRQETRLLPGFIWVRPLASRKAYHVKLKLIDERHLLCSFSGWYTDSAHQPNPRQVVLDVH